MKMSANAIYNFNLQPQIDFNPLKNNVLNSDEMLFLYKPQRKFQQSGIRLNESRERPICQEEIFETDIYRHYFSEKGNFNKWLGAVKKLRKNPILKVIIATSFASYLLDRFGSKPIIINIYGNHGAGKTLSLTLAESIWGNPRTGRLVQHYTRKSDIINVANTLKNLPVAVDDFVFLNDDKNLLNDMSLGFSSGNGKMPSNNNWQCVFLLSGEEKIQDKRVINLLLKNDTFKNPAAVFNALNNNFGAAGRIFMNLVGGHLNSDSLYAEIGSNHIIELEKKQTASALLFADKLATKHIFKDNNYLLPDEILEMR